MRVLATNYQGLLAFPHPYHRSLAHILIIVVLVIHDIGSNLFAALQLLRAAPLHKGDLCKR